jgi:hypothetical protein
MDGKGVLGLPLRFMLVTLLLIMISGIVYNEIGKLLLLSCEQLADIEIKKIVETAESIYRIGGGKKKMEVSIPSCVKNVSFGYLPSGESENHYFYLIDGKIKSYSSTARFYPSVIHPGEYQITIDVGEKVLVKV